MPGEEKKAKGSKEPDLSEVIGGTLNLFGLKIDLAKLISSPEDVKGGLEELRERLKRAGGKETLSGEEWRSGQVSISGHFKTSGVLGDREYHVGTAGASGGRRGRGMGSEPPETVEPPVDIFHEEEEIQIVAEVPGVDISDLELKVGDGILSLSTKPAAPRRYSKRVELGSEVDADSLKATCRNGILEIHLRKKETT